MRRILIATGALALAIAALAPIPASAEDPTVATLEATTVIEPAWATTTMAPVSVHLSEPAAGDLTLTVGFTPYTGNATPHTWEQTHVIVIGDGQSQATATFTVTGDDRDVTRQYISRVTSAPPGVDISSWVLTAVTDTTRDGELFCDSSWSVNHAPPTAYEQSAGGVCPTEEKSWASVELPDGSGTLTGVWQQTMSNIVDPHRTAPEVGDFGTTSADVASGIWSDGKLSIEAWGMHTTATARCDTLGGEPILALASGIGRIRIRYAAGVAGLPDVVVHLGPVDEPRTFTFGDLTVALNHTVIERHTASGPWVNGAPQPKVAATQYAVLVKSANPDAPHWTSLAKSGVYYPNGSPCNA